MPPKYPCPDCRGTKLNLHGFGGVWVDGEQVLPPGSGCPACLGTGREFVLHVNHLGLPSHREDREAYEARVAREER